MSQAQGNSPDQSSTQRAEQVLTTLGHRIGFLAGMASQRVEQAIRSTRPQSHQQDSHESHKPSSAPRAKEAMPQAMTRAEELVQQAELDLGQWAAQLGLQSQRLTARIREDLEDIWADAQHQRNIKKPS
ncbi:hypothetical protein EPA93_46795 [Ktedonosporobacter rubrisoli]|uniref:Uncharacterized protein n=1 Tax=Ktedonosporobacter rubrisoli TaxID=2509675 RepID=A0A4P6K456_KTERU|nr:hypothetical protein [Ktedonosporobacter rubrisoli]QBD83078.1 hypothetical protein EPA93_46795 [Ktedonosporobacter rubrisoli]